MRSAWCVVVLPFVWAGALHSQEPNRPVQDTVRAPTRARADSTNPRPDRPIPPPDTTRQLADSLNPDSTRPLMPLLFHGQGPRPQSSRYVFDPDALRWSGAMSLGELLMLIPGVTAVRAGSYGQPETVSYMGQGAASIELYRDGFQLDPLGEDSVSFDTGRFDIGMYRRIEVEILPSILRIHLISDTQTALRARTEASFATGDNQTNSYRVRYLNRFRDGMGVGVGVSFLGTQGPPTSRATATGLGIWGKVMWMPTVRSGVEFQLYRQTYESDAITPAFTGVDIPSRNVGRTDLTVRAFSSTRADGLGLRFDALLGSSTYSDTSQAVKRSSGQAAVSVGFATPHFSSEVWARLRDNNLPIDIGARGAFSPLRVLSVSAYARNRQVLGGGSMQDLSGSVELRPLAFLAVHGAARWRRMSDSLFVASATAQTVLDWSAGAGIASRLFTFDVSLTERGDYSPRAFGLFREQVPGMQTGGGLAPQLSFRFQPRSWLSLSGWMRFPDSDSIAYDPPTHTVTRLTFRSQFLPTLRRGLFDLELQLEVEGWGSGVAGIDSTGAAIPFSGHTVVNFYLQFRLVGALIYWTMRNTQLETYTYLPGFVMPRSLQRFGIRWEFNN